MYTRENTWDEAIARNATATGVPRWVIKTTIGTESSFDPTAFRAEPQFKDASRGLMQVLEGTARTLGYRGDVGNDVTRTGGLYVPEISIQLGTKLLKQLADRYPGVTWDKRYAAYNAGSIRFNLAGRLVNEPNVARWRTIAEYFRRLEETGGPAPPLV